MSHLKVGQGGTVRLPLTVSLGGTGELVDADTPGPRVDILDPDDNQLVTDAVPIRDSLGTYHYDYAVGGAAPLGVWHAHWTGSVNGSAVEDDDEFEVVSAASFQFASNLLVTVPELAAKMRIEAFDDEDIAELVLMGVQAACEKWVSRPVTQRTFSETLYPGRQGSLFFTHDPVVTIESLSVEGTEQSLDGLDIRSWGVAGYLVVGLPSAVLPEFLRVDTQYPRVDVRYVAGIDGRHRDNRLLWLTCLRAAQREMRRDLEDAAHVTNIGVEGESWSLLEPDDIFTKRELHSLTSFKKRDGGIRW